MDDVIHGNFTLPAYTREIIETAHFKRLRNLKQLGVSDRIFKKAIHTRFVCLFM